MLIVPSTNDLGEGFNRTFIEVPLKVIIFDIGVIKRLFFSLKPGTFLIDFCFLRSLFLLVAYLVDFKYDRGVLLRIDHCL